MVTIVDKIATDSTITSATLEVSNARNSAHALDIALNELDKYGWTVSIERYEASMNADGSYTLTLY